MQSFKSLLKRTASKLSLCSSTSSLPSEQEQQHQQTQTQIQTQQDQPSGPLPWDFITRKGASLYEGDKVFRWVSYNVPAMLLLEDRPPSLYGFPLCRKPVPNPERDCNGLGYGFENGRSCIVSPHGQDPYEWVVPDPFEQEDAIRTVAAGGGRVIRTYTLGFGPRYHVRSPRNYHEPALVAMDQALSLARKHRVRLIIPLVNNNFSDNLSYGDYGFMAKARGKSPMVFFSDPQLRQDFKDLIADLLNRVNTLTGIRYGDDPTILAWQFGNELGGWKSSPPPGDWTVEMAKHVKSLAPRTLVMDGTMGAHDARRRFAKAALESEFVDVFSNHYYYGSSDLSRIDRDAKFVAGYKKAFIIGEFGLCSTSVIETVLKRVVATPYISGALIWSLRYHSAEGGFYTHYEKDNYWSYHAPGFPKASGFTTEEQTIVPMMRKHALLIQGLPANTPYPIPSAPGLIAGVKPSALRWRGASWAASYRVWRAPSAPSSASDGSATRETATAHWELLADRVLDNVEWGQPIYADKSAVAGSWYMYRIQSVSADGVDGQGDLVIGPIEA
ncbi:glycoside hydrolase superfamily [Entophlyctis helioformis]|nr:glycoside hydrolase superfamily [Entophlyctis helioformis]